MATRPTSKQLAWLANTMAARMLVDAASPERSIQLVEALRHWLPDVDGLTLREVAAEVQTHLRGLSGAVDVRLNTWVEQGRAEPLPGCDGRI